MQPFLKHFASMCWVVTIGWTQLVAGQVSVKTSATVRMGDTVQMTAPVSGENGADVIWEVNAKVGGSVATGTISPTGLYVAPLTVAKPLTVNITGVVQGTKASSATTLTVEPCAPVQSGMVSWWPGRLSWP